MGPPAALPLTPSALSWPLPNTARNPAAAGATDARENRDDDGACAHAGPADEPRNRGHKDRNPARDARTRRHQPQARTAPSK